MTLPPRGDPERLEAMAQNVTLGLPPCHGDDGTAVAYPEPPADYRPVTRPGAVSIPGLLTDPDLRYFGKYWGWWTKGPGPRRKPKTPNNPRSRNPKTFTYLGDRSEVRYLAGLSGKIKPNGDRN